MHVRRYDPIRPTAMDTAATPRAGIRPVLTFVAVALAALAFTLWLAAHGLAPAAPCLDDPGAACEPF